MPFAGSECPHCLYALDGLPDQSTLCPECGGSLSTAAFARAAAIRLARSGRARLALLASPGIGIIGGALIFAGTRIGFAALTFFFLCLWFGGAAAIYFISRAPKSRRTTRAAILGFPLGIAYFAACFAIAFVIILIIRAAT